MTSLFKRSILLPFGSRTSHLSLCTVTTARSMASNTAKQVHRITMFKVPNSNDIQSILDKYATMAQDAKKVCLLHGRVAFQPSHVYPPRLGVLLILFATGRQTIHPPLRGGTGSSRRTQPGLQSSGSDNVCQYRGHEVLRRGVRGTCGAQGGGQGQGRAASVDGVL